MSIDLETLLRVIDACEVEEESPPALISLVIPRKGGGGSGQIFLEWQPGKTLRDYLQHPTLASAFSLYRAAYSRIVDHRNIRRRLTYAPQPGDELRFLRIAPIGEM